MDIVTDTVRLLIINKYLLGDSLTPRAAETFLALLLSVTERYKFLSDSHHRLEFLKLQLDLIEVHNPKYNYGWYSFIFYYYLLYHFRGIFPGGGIIELLGTKLAEFPPPWNFVNFMSKP